MVKLQKIKMVLHLHTGKLFWLRATASQPDDSIVCLAAGLVAK